MPIYSVLKAALAYRAAGLSVIPVGGDKKPLVAWKMHQKRPAGEGQIRRWFSRYPKANLGLVCGRVSDGLLVLDFDHDARSIYWRWKASVGRLAEKLPVVRTGKGIHVYLRAANPGGNRRLATDASGRVLIETRGEGGYIIAPPSLHPSGKRYHWVQADHQVPQLSAGALAGLLEAATALDEQPGRTDWPELNGNGQISSPDNWRLRRYALAVLAREAAALVAAPAGWRNQLLNRVAFKAGRYAGAGLLTVELVEGMLAAACEAGGNYLIPDDGRDAFQATLRSGLQAGMARAVDPEELMRRLNGHEDQK